MIKIAVNTRLLLKNKLEGIGWFTFEIFSRMAKNHPEIEFHYIFDRPYSNDFITSSNIIPHVIGPQARHPFLYYLWFEYSLKSELDRIKPDIFVSPDGYLSLRSPFKQIAVFHDLNFEHYPEFLPFLERKYYKYFFPKYAKKAANIVTVSEFSKSDIEITYQVSNDKISVVSNGFNSSFHPLLENEKGQIRKKYAKGERFFVFVGALHQRKNVSGILKAFDLFKSKNPLSKHKLLLAGSKKWTNEIEIVLSKMKHKTDVVFLGRVEHSDLGRIIAASDALLYPSFYEGFGIPILEGFACGIPVITSNCSSMPEVAGDAAVYVNPNSTEEISDALSLVLDVERIKPLIEKGKARLSNYSWDKSAERMYEVIKANL